MPQQSAFPRAVRTAVTAALAEALAVVFPTWCAGCDAPDVSLCASCAAALVPAPRRRLLPDGTPVDSALAFVGVPARILRALKEDGRTALARPLGDALSAVWPAGAAVAVPVPSSRAAWRRRGYAPVELIARRAGLPVRRLLRPVGRTRDQRGLARGERWANVAGGLRATGAAAGPVVVVDDVLTTGATVAEAVRALRAAGLDVCGAVTVAATPRHADRRGGRAGLPDYTRERDRDFAGRPHYGGGTQGEPGSALDREDPEQGGQVWRSTSSAWVSASVIVSAP